MDGENKMLTEAVSAIRAELSKLTAVTGHAVEKLERRIRDLEAQVAKLGKSKGR
jgi:hypothetical protein